MSALGRSVVLLAVTAAVAAPAHAAAPPTAIWDRAGVFVGDTANFPGPWTLAEHLSTSGFSWIALQLHNGLVERRIDARWFDAFRARGIAVGGWGIERTHPRAEARLGARLVDRYALDFYIANAEATYKTDTGGVWRRSGQFARAFRAVEPMLPAGLATYGAPTCSWCILPMDFAAWRRAHFSLLPEAYYNLFRAYRPDLTVAHARRAGWSVADVHPLLGVFHRYPAANYVPLLQRAGTRGFSIFVAEAARSTDYVALAPRIAQETAGLPVFSEGPLGSPVAVAPPVLAGRPVEGSALAVGAGAWEGAAPMARTYEWQRCGALGCATVLGATDPTYTPGFADIGFAVRAVVHETNVGGTADAASAATEPIAAAPRGWPRPAP